MSYELALFRVQRMSFTIEQTKERRASFRNCTCRISEAGRFIAHCPHADRGDGNGIESANGSKDLFPLGQRVEFIQGGGPEPLTLSRRVVDCLKQ